MSVPTRARRRPNDGLPEQPAGTWAFTGLPAVTFSRGLPLVFAHIICLALLASSLFSTGRSVV